jgi:hypothetical protein
LQRQNVDDDWPHNSICTLCFTTATSSQLCDQTTRRNCAERTSHSTTNGNTIPHIFAFIQSNYWNISSFPTVTLWLTSGLSAGKPSLLQTVVPLCPFLINFTWQSPSCEARSWLTSSKTPIFPLQTHLLSVWCV